MNLNVLRPREFFAQIGLSRILLCSKNWFVQARTMQMCMCAKHFEIRVYVRFQYVFKSTRLLILKVVEFGLVFGFIVVENGSSQIICSRGRSEKRKKKGMPTCTFAINYSSRPNLNKVHLKNSCFVHSAGCNPSQEQLQENLRKRNLIQQTIHGPKSKIQKKKQTTKINSNT